MSRSEYFQLSVVNGASAPVLIGLFLMIPLAWFLVRDWLQHKRMQWMMLACLAMTGLLFAFLFVPGWDAVAHLLLLDRSTSVRARIGLLLVSVIAIALLVRRLDEGDAAVPREITWTAVIAAASSIIMTWSELANGGDAALVNSEHHVLTAVFFVLSVLLYTQRFPLPASLLFLVISFLLSSGVNPLYRGVFDLTETSIGQNVERINQDRPGTWLGVGSVQLSAVLFETGVRSFNGVQLYPAREMWNDVDPAGRYADVWNRYASVVWQTGTGEPRLENPQPDVITATFDSCSTFAQQHVAYVMAQAALDQPCLTLIDQATSGPSTYWFYEVAK